MRLLDRGIVAMSFFGLLVASCKKNEVTEEVCDGFVLIHQSKGPTLGYSPESGIKILEVDGYRFKDLNRNGRLDVYEDWREDVEKRIVDLAEQLSVEEIAGMMLYSNHQAIPNSNGYTEATWDGKSFEESGVQPWELTDQQKGFLADDHMRHVLITSVENPEVAARWNNAAQAFVEGIDHGIPANNSSDPRNSARADAEYNAGGGGRISMWPGSLGMAATFDPELMREFGRTAAAEYRALGFATALSPQVDLATEPRWTRFSGTFGEDPELGIAMAEAYCDGFQDPDGNGWSDKSVNAMVKHWPGGGTGEGGRDAHMVYGKYAVYPGGMFELHKRPFIEGAFKLKGKTSQASAVMPYYTISFDQTSENVGNGFNHDIITDMLRKDQNYDGVVCTDWCITWDAGLPVSTGRPYGVESLSVAERHYKVLMAGVDQFGGNNEVAPVIEAYNIGVKELGKEAMDKRMRKSAVRLLRNIMRPGLFENPYLDASRSNSIVGCPEYMAKGYEAQLRSVVMLKNHASALPLKKDIKVYVPERDFPAYMGMWDPTPARHIVPVTKALGDKYMKMVDTPEEADVAIVFIDSPMSRFGYEADDAKNGGTGYVPLSLQYSDYTSEFGRETSIAGGDPLETFTNRSYRGKTGKTVNKCHMDLVHKTHAAMNGKPVIVVVNTRNPFVASEIEPYADALLLIFDIQNQAVLDIIFGNHEPSGRLPMQMPLDMKTVELQKEDVPHDMECYRDADGNVYDFKFGLNWKGTI